MKWIRQFLIILIFTFMGECLRALIPLLIPAGIYGMILLFAALCLGIIKVDQVEGAADFLLEIMPLFFLPAGVGLIERWTQLRALWLPILLTTILLTILVMVVTGHVTQLIIRQKKQEVEEDE